MPQLEAAIRNLNQDFSGAKSPVNGIIPPHSKIQFYLKCSVSYVEFPALYNFNYQNNTSRNLWKNFQETNFNYGALNVYFPNVISSNTGKASYVDELPQSNNADKFNAYRIWMNRIQVHTSTFAHEIGHALGLSHTHDGYGNASNNGEAGSCKQEKVNRNAQNSFFGCGNTKTNCQWYGDALCDTEADPEIDSEDDLDVISDIWIYTGVGVDKDGTQWNPPILNFMSYSLPFIRRQFSPQQTGIMYSTLISSPVSGFNVHNTNQFIDVYEPDNLNIGFDNQLLNYNQTQHRGLHRDIHGNNGATNTFSYCDEDFMRFSVPEGQTYKVNIFTEAVPNKKQVDTELFVYSSSGNLVASNDNKSTGDFYSGIYELTLVGGFY